MHVATSLRELILFYITCVCPILEYGSPIFHYPLPSYLSKDLCAMKIIYPELSYAKALELSGFLTLCNRRGTSVAKLLDEICGNQSQSLHKLLYVGTWHLLLNLWFCNSFKIVNYAGSSFFINKKLLQL